MRALASAPMLLTAAGFGQGIGPLAVVMLTDALKNDFGAEAVRYSLLSAAVTTTPGGPVVYLGGAVDPRRYSAGELIQPARRRPLPFVFIIVLTPPTSRRALGCRPIDLYVIYITDTWRKTGQKQAE
jgi:hypothetical protein